MCGNWLGLVECDSTRSGSQRSGIFHAVCVAAVAPTGRVDTERKRQEERCVRGEDQEVVAGREGDGSWYLGAGPESQPEEHPWL